MKIFLSLVAGMMLMISCLLAQPGAETLTGIVTDPAGKPLAGVSVFLNSTSVGTTTRVDGSFTLKAIPRGKYQLVISAIGYAPFVTDLNGNQLPPELHVSLRQKATELEAITVEPYLKDGWEKWGKYFLNNFLGTGTNAEACTIKNKDVLRFHYSNKYNRLTVSATEPLIIENFALGYTLEYPLEEFSSDGNTHIVNYFGFPFFREMATKRDSRRRKWEKNRQQAYSGSIMHFMRSLYAGHLTDEGFITTQQVKLPDTVYQQKKSVYKTLLINTDSLLTTYPDATRSLFFTGRLNVYFTDIKKGIFRRGSAMELITPSMVRIEENGNYYPPQELLSSGFWGLTEKIGNLLPMNFGLSIN